VAGYRVSPSTGTVLIRSDAPLDFEALASSAREAGLFELRGGAPAASRSMADPFGELARSPHAARALMGLLLAMSVIQISRGQIMAPAASLLWYAFDVAGGMKRR